MKPAIQPIVNGKAEENRYVTAEEFRELFTAEVSDLYQLAFLIIADCAKSEECLIVAMNDSIDGNFVAKEWARTWARRVVIRNAIRIVGEAEGTHSSDFSNHIRPLRDVNLREIPLVQFKGFAQVLSLLDFERIVFVLRVLERYSVRDCALLLGRSQQDVLDAEIRAAEQIAAYEDIMLHRDTNLSNQINSCTEK